jgi:hypothetical protein
LGIGGGNWLSTPRGDWSVSGKFGSLVLRDILDHGLARAKTRAVPDCLSVSMVCLAGNIVSIGIQNEERSSTYFVRRHGYLYRMIGGQGFITIIWYPTGCGDV